MYHIRWGGALCCHNVQTTSNLPTRHHLLPTQVVFVLPCKNQTPPQTQKPANPFRSGTQTPLRHMYSDGRRPFKQLFERGAWNSWTEEEKKNNMNTQFVNQPWTEPTGIFTTCTFINSWVIFHSESRQTASKTKHEVLLHQYCPNYAGQCLLVDRDVSPTLHLCVDTRKEQHCRHWFHKTLKIIQPAAWINEVLLH